MFCILNLRILTESNTIDDRLGIQIAHETKLSAGTGQVVLRKSNTGNVNKF